MVMLLSVALAAEVDGPWKAGSYVDLAVSGATVHAAWVEEKALRYATVGGAAVTVGTGVVTGDNGQVRPEIAIDGSGRPVIAWSDGAHIHLSTLGAAWVDRVVDGGGAGHRELLALAIVAGQPVVAWLDMRGATTNVYAWMDGRESLVYAGGEDGVCMCCKPALFARSDGLTLALRDADGARRDIRGLRYAGGAWTDLGDLTTGKWSPGGCPTDGPALSDTTLLVSDGRTGKRRVYEVSRSGERMLPAVNGDAEVLYPHVLPDASWVSWVEAVSGKSTLYARDGPSVPAALTSTGARLEPGDPVVVGTEIWQPWQGEAAHVERVATQAPPMR